MSMLLEPNQTKPQSERFVSDEKIIDVHIVIVTYNSSQLIEKCIDAIRKSKLNASYLITVFDNGSADSAGYCRFEAEFPEVKVVLNASNIGFGRANNSAHAMHGAKYTLLVNPDAIVDPLAIAKALRIMSEDATVAIVGANLTDFQGLPQPSARFSPTPWSVFLRKVGLWKRLYPSKDDHIWPRINDIDCDWVPGCFYLVSALALERVGLFDPRFFLYYEEVDHCKRVREAGFRVVCAADVEVRHIGGASAETITEIDRKGRQISKLLIESELLFMRKHFGLLGLFAHLVLGFFGLTLICLKSLIKSKTRGEVSVELAYQVEAFKTTFRTRLGSLPIH
jgi:N-acetylglucosaminyl-diphospho-decaprenol L-rhamnosyltransferase